MSARENGFVHVPGRVIHVRGTCIYFYFSGVIYPEKSKVNKTRHPSISPAYLRARSLLLMVMCEPWFDFGDGLFLRHSRW